MIWRRKNETLTCDGKKAPKFVYRVLYTPKGYVPQLKSSCWGFWEGITKDFELRSGVREMLKEAAFKTQAEAQTVLDEYKYYCNLLEGDSDDLAN